MRIFSMTFSAMNIRSVRQHGRIRNTLRRVSAILIVLSSLLTMATLPVEAVNASFADSFLALSGRTDATDPNVKTSDEPTVLFDPSGTGAPVIDGASYILYDVEANVFILGRNQDTPLSPASITKVMTVLLALENLNMTDTITVTRDMYDTIPSDYVRVGLVEGEMITVEEAIYSCLLISANDAAMALAIHMAGSAEEFSKMMNTRALELGCKKTNFTNPYGFSDPENLTTAHDMALITAEVLKHSEYTKISTTANYSLPPTNKRLESLSIKSGNKFVSTTDYAYDKYIGGKTGFSDLSAYTITAGARSGGRTLVAVVMGASSSNLRYENVKALIEYGFSQYSSIRIQTADYTTAKNQVIEQVVTTIDVAGYPFSITDTKFEVLSYLTIVSSRASLAHADSFSMEGVALKANESIQVLQIPLIRTFSDDTSNQIGTLTITVCDEAGANKLKQKEISWDEIGTIIFRAGLVLVLLVIIVIVILVFRRFQHAKTRKQNRKKPKVL